MRSENKKEKEKKNGERRETKRELHRANVITMLSFHFNSVGKQSRFGTISRFARNSSVFVGRVPRVGQQTLLEHQVKNFLSRERVSFPRTAEREHERLPLSCPVLLELIKRKYRSKWVVYRAENNHARRPCRLIRPGINAKLPGPRVGETLSRETPD